MKKVFMYLSIALLGAIVMLGALNINWCIEDYDEMTRECNQLKAANLNLKHELRIKSDSINALSIKNDSLSITSIVMYNSIMANDRDMMNTCIDYLNQLVLDNKLPFCDYIKTNRVTYKYKHGNNY
jgi:hypothetical protein